MASKRERELRAEWVRKRLRQIREEQRELKEELLSYMVKR